MSISRILLVLIRDRTVRIHDLSDVARTSHHIIAMAAPAAERKTVRPVHLYVRICSLYSHVVCVCLDRLCAHCLVRRASPDTPGTSHVHASSRSKRLNAVLIAVLASLTRSLLRRCLLIYAIVALQGSASAGMIGRVFCHPIDTVKARLQASTATTKQSMAAHLQLRNLSYAFVSCLALHLAS